MSKNHKISRRKFLGQASCAALGSTTFLSTALQMGMINTAAARPHIIGSNNDYKAIICVLLAGGADSHNMLVPHDQNQYDNYADLRSDLALSRETLRSITSLRTDIPNAGRTFGLHPGLSNIENIYNAGDLAFISNIGTLVEPINNVSELWNGSKRLPLGLYSHADQIMQWQTSVPQDRSAVGVGGRIADMLNDMNSIQEISMNISLDGKNRFQAGNQVVEYAIANNFNDIGIESLPMYWSNSGFLTETRDNAVKNVVERTYANIFQDTYADLTAQTYESLDLFKTALEKRPGYASDFSPHYLSQDLKMMADIISVQNLLGAQRQIFFTTFGGWDHHDEVINAQGAMLPLLDSAIGSLYNALGERSEDNLRDKVTVLTISDFGRTITSNGNGSDHAWGGNMMLMGGAVNGHNVYGEYPDITLNNDLNIDERGRFIPSISSDEMYAELALWFGVSPNDLNYILPNIGNFNDYSLNPSPIGLFN